MTRIPIACSLPPADAAQQAGEWADLHRHVVARERLPHGVAVTFRAEAADTVADLSAREATCCAFLTIATEATEAGVRVEITSEDPDALPVIEALAGAG